MEIYNGMLENVRRRYDSLAHFVGENKVHLPGDVLCVSTKNNNVYDMFIVADGIHTFLQLYKMKKEGKEPSGEGGGNIPSEGNHDGAVNTFSEIVDLLQGLPEGSNLKAILDNINTEALTQEEKQALEDLINGPEITEEELQDDWEDAMRNAMDEGEGE